MATTISFVVLERSFEIIYYRFFIFRLKLAGCPPSWIFAVMQKRHKCSHVIFLFWKYLPIDFETQGQQWLPKCFPFTTASCRGVWRALSYVYNSKFSLKTYTEVSVIRIFNNTRLTGQIFNTKHRKHENRRNLL